MKETETGHILLEEIASLTSEARNEKRLTHGVYLIATEQWDLTGRGYCIMNVSVA